MIRVAFATSDGTTVDQHFARCPWFDIYDLSTERAVLIGSRTADQGPSTPDNQDLGADGRVIHRVNLLRDCAILYITSIGGAAAARVVNARIHPLKVPEGTPIAELNERLRQVLSTSPPPWLRKILEADEPAASVGSPR